MKYYPTATDDTAYDTHTEFILKLHNQYDIIIIQMIISYNYSLVMTTCDVYTAADISFHLSGNVTEYNPRDAP